MTRWGSLQRSPGPLAALKLLTPSALDLRRLGALPHAFGVQSQSVPVLLFSHTNTGQISSDNNDETVSRLLISRSWAFYSEINLVACKFKWQN